MYDAHLLGPQGEKIAADYLSGKGYRILERNYRFRRNEIDIIARHRGVLCFVEVKTRSSDEKGDPLDAVTPQKQQEIIKAAKSYLFRNGGMDTDCRFDVVAVRVREMGQGLISSFTVEHVIDAFWAAS
ncbi:MAG: YraN family protein [Chlorobiaceae bacterium]|jgi:putative endonuclease|nr:YraN family protein [Chlorobiaceae bacterium]